VSVLDVPEASDRPLDIDLSAQVNEPGQYEVRIEGLESTGALPLFEGKAGAAEFLEKIDANTYRLNRTQALGEGASTGIRLTTGAARGAKMTVRIRPKS
jgi:hypothetical protein